MDKETSQPQENGIVLSECENLVTVSAQNLDQLSTEWLKNATKKLWTEEGQRRSTENKIGSLIVAYLKDSGETLLDIENEQATTFLANIKNNPQEVAKGKDKLNDEDKILCKQLIIGAYAHQTTRTDTTKFGRASLPVENYNTSAASVYNRTSMGHWKWQFYIKYFANNASDPKKMDLQANTAYGALWEIKYNGTSLKNNMGIFKHAEHAILYTLKNDTDANRAWQQVCIRALKEYRKPSINRCFKPKSIKDPKMDALRQGITKLMTDYPKTSFDLREIQIKQMERCFETLKGWLGKSMDFDATVENRGYFLIRSRTITEGKSYIKAIMEKLAKQFPNARVRDSFGFAHIALSLMPDEWVRISPGFLPDELFGDLAVAIDCENSTGLKEKIKEFEQTLPKPRMPVWSFPLMGLVNMALEVLKEESTQFKCYKDTSAPNYWFLKTTTNSIISNINKAMVLITHKHSEKTDYLNCYHLALNCIESLSETSRMAAALLSHKKGWEVFGLPAVMEGKEVNCYLVDSCMQGILASAILLDNDLKTESEANQIEKIARACKDYCSYYEVSDVTFNLNKKSIPNMQKSKERILLACVGERDYSNSKSHTGLEERETMNTQAFSEFAKGNNYLGAVVDITYVKKPQIWIDLIKECKKPVALVCSLAKFGQIGQDKYQGATVYLNKAAIEGEKTAHERLKGIANESYEPTRSVWFDLMQRAGVFIHGEL